MRTTAKPAKAAPLAASVFPLDGGLLILGTALAETLSGGNGNDSIVADNGNDLVSAGNGADTVSGGNGNDLISGELGSDRLSGDAGNDTLSGGTGNDTASGGAGDDIIYGGAGRDLLSGDAGNDILVGDSGLDTQTGDQSTDTLLGGAGNDIIVGSKAADFIDGGTGDDTFSFASAEQLADDASVIGGTGRDTLAVLSGSDDLTLVDSDFDSVSGVEALDLQGLARKSVTLGESAINAFANGITVTTTASGDGLLLDADLFSRNVVATGSIQVDTLTGGSGNDILIGDDGGDIINGGAGRDILIGGSSILGGSANDDVDVIDGGSGDDILVFYGAADMSTDVIRGGADIDTLRFETGSSALTLVDTDFDDVAEMEVLDLGGTGAQSVTLGVEGNFSAFSNGITIRAQASAVGLNLQAADFGSVVIARGTNNSDVMVGGVAADTLVGLAGADSIQGGNGRDAIDGGSGNDWAGFTSSGALNFDATVIGGFGTDTIQMLPTSSGGISSIDLIDTDFDKVVGFENLRFDGSGTQKVTLGTFTNRAFASGITITANTLATSLEVQGGSSTVTINATGTDNADTLAGGSANDTLSGGAGNDSIFGGTGNDYILGGAGNDLLVFSSQTDLSTSTVDGGMNVDTIVMETGFNTLTLVDTDFDDVDDVGLLDLRGAGDTTVTLGTNAVAAFFNGIVVTTNSAANSLNLNASAFTLTVDATGSSNNDTIVGGSSNDTLIGLAGNDSLQGGAGNDSIVAATGNDTISGGAGNDSIDLGLNNDSYVIVAGTSASLADVSTANGFDTITAGFTASGTDDSIRFNAISATTKGTVTSFATATATNSTLTATANVVVFDDSTAGLLFADATALAAATTSFAGITDGNIVVVYAATDNGDARVALVTLASGDVTDAVDLLTLTGVDVDNFSSADFVLA